MARTKREQAEHEALQLDLRHARALRWSDHQPAPDLPAPEHGLGQRTEGWTFNLWTRRVVRAWSEASVHGEGRYVDTRHNSGSQGGIALFSTRALAYGGLRRALEQQSAVWLAHLDAEIARGEVDE